MTLVLCITMLVLVACSGDAPPTAPAGKVVARDHAGDRAAMMAIWEAVGQPKFRKWGTKSSLRKWDHIEVDRASGRVVSLDLNIWAISQETGRMVEVPPAVSELTALKRLSTGSSFNFPIGISNLVHLEWLNIWSQEATELPDEYGKLSNLTYFRIWCGECFGSIPARFGQLHNLDTLIVVGPRMKGSLPTLHNRNLKVLNLSRMDSLSGALVLALDDLPSLESVIVKSSQLEYPLPTFANSPNVRHITIGRRDMTALGPLPPEWGNLHQIETINLYNVVSELPPSWGALTNVQSIGLGPEIYGELPPEWSGMTSLEWLTIRDQEIEGVLPASWSALKNLKVLNLEENLIDGPLPASWASMDSLTTLRLSYNFFDGTGLPPEWGHFKNLEVFECQECGLEGPIPDEWENLTSMIYLRLSDNYLSGIIPDWWDSWPNVESIGLSDNDLYGPYPQSLGRIKGLAGRGDQLEGRGIFTGCVPRMLVTRDTYWSIRYDGWNWKGPNILQSGPNMLRFCDSGPHYNWEAADARSNLHN